MKKLDLYIIKRFTGPFFLTFFITLFLIVMQFLWKYVDDLVGKGLELHLIAELLFYASASFVPLALPLAVLLSSIMTFGDLGENNELVAVKSSGISLMRFMRFLILFVGVISFGTFFFSNNILPRANLKFASLLHDIRKQKPALNIKEGVFYNGIEGYSIRVGKKHADNKTVEDILVYDHTSGRGCDVILIAGKGEMYSSPDEQYLILKLYHGRQYQELPPEKGEEAGYEHIRTEFAVWEKVFDLSQFKLSRTDESLFKDHYQMLDLKHLANEIDTIRMEIEKRKQNMHRYLKPYFTFLRFNIDSLLLARGIEIKLSPAGQEEAAALLEEGITPQEKLQLIRRAQSLARNVKGFADVTSRDVKYQTKYLIKHQNEWHRKFTLSFACMILFFVGAPLGALIRKGGFGMPLVMAIVFFIIFHVLTVMGIKLAEEGVWSSFTGMWFASAVLFPIGVFLTYKANQDSRLFMPDYYFKKLREWLQRFSGM